MKRLWLFLGLVAVVLSLAPSVAWADENWQINRFHSDVAVQPDGKVKVTETIEADFGSTAKHGIYRDVPYQYQAHDQTTYTTIDPWSVQRDGQDEEYSQSLANGYWRLTIGDPDKKITGKHTYAIVYFVSGVLKSYDDFDELYWNVTGNNWPVTIDQASATVTMPRSGIVTVACYQGDYGSKDTCQSVTISPLEVRFSATKPLAAGQNLSVAVGYTKGLLPILKIDRPQSPTERVIEAASQPTNWLIILVSLAVGLVAPLTLWWQRGRDKWWQQPGVLDTNQAAMLKPLFGKPQVVAEFTPPESLRPAQLGLLIDQRVNTLDVTSSIVDLACRGYLTITELPKSWVFGSADYQLDKKDKADTDLLPYEQKLLGNLFSAGASVKLSSLKNTFYQSLAEVQKMVYQDLTERKYFSANPDSIRTLYVSVGVVLAVAGGFLVWLLFSQALLWLAPLALATVAAGVGITVFSQVMPQRTALGYEVYRRVLGYKLFITTAEKYQQQFMEKENLFNQVLPYAMVLGLTHKFAEAMKQIGYQPSQTNSWYTGTSAFNLMVFSQSMNTMSSAFSSTMASTPSGSGSGGGGFSGGGFGGGGGGSW